MKSLSNPSVFLCLVLMSGGLNALSAMTSATKANRYGVTLLRPLVYQYQVNIPFGQLNRYLCRFNKTEYQRFANLQKTDEIAAHGYLVRLDLAECDTGQEDYAHLVRAAQATPDSPVIVEYWGRRIGF